MTSNVSHERLISTDPEVDVPLGPRHSKPSRLGRFHEAVVTSSLCSAIFVCGFTVGLVWTR